MTDETTETFDPHNPMYQWYQDFHQSKETEEFNKWWIAWYGLPTDYADEGEYWVRKSFALSGWLARQNEL